MALITTLPQGVRNDWPTNLPQLQADGTYSRPMATSQNIADIIGVANQSALQWYSTVTQKPVATGAPGSMMQNVFGTDFRGGPTVIGQTASPIAIVLVIAVVVVGVVLVARR